MKSNDSNEKPAPPRKRGSKENDRLKGSKDGGKDAGKGHHGSRDSALPAGGGIGAGAKPKKRTKKLARKKAKASKELSKSDNSEEDLKKPPTKLSPKDEVSSTTNKYVVKKELGEGGFGAVYQVKAETKPKNATTKIFALKTEFRGPKSPNRLKIEVKILSTLLGLDEKSRERFAMMIDRGQTTDFVFIVMTLLGPSLASIREDILHKEFTQSTAFRIGIESLEAIKILHLEGFLHRDIKPANFTIGYGKNYTKIVLIDFGISRKMFKDNVLRPPRKSVEFLGTVRFASRNCHTNTEQGRNSDCESWFYMICDVFNQSSLPWKKTRDKDLVYALKCDLRVGSNSCLDEIPKEFGDIMVYIDKLKYEDTPDYQMLRSSIEHAAKRTNTDLTQPWDWEAACHRLHEHDAEDEN